MIKHFNFLILLMIVFSCKKEVQKETVQSAKDKSFAQMQFLDVIKNTLDLVPLYVVNSSAIDPLIKISCVPDISNATYPKIITIDYGKTNADFNDGKTRSGKVLIKIEGSGMLQESFQITFQDFYLNETMLLGTLNLVFNSDSGVNQYDLTINNDVKCTNANGTMSWNGSGTLKRVKGETTISVLDDIYEFSEISKGQDFKGRAYESNSTTNYTVDFSCRYLVVSGVAKFSPHDLDTQYLDYGDKTCDGTVKVSFFDSEPPFYFTLP